MSSREELTTTKILPTIPLKEKIPEKRRGGIVIKPDPLDRTCQRKGTFFCQIEASVVQARKSTHINQTYLNLKCTKRSKKEFIDKEKILPRELGGVFSCRFQPKGQKIVLGFGRGLIQIFNNETGELEEIIKPMDDELPIMSMKFNPKFNNYCYAGSISGIIWQCDLEKNLYFPYADENQNEINSLDINKNGNFLASVGKDVIIRIYDLNTKHLISMYKNPDPKDSCTSFVQKYHSMRLYAACFNPDHPDILVTGGWDKIMLVWDMRVKSEPVQNMFGVHISGEAIDMRDRIVVTGSWLVSGSLQTWDLRNGKLIETIFPINRPYPVDGEFLYTVQFFDGDPYNNHVIYGGNGSFEMINLKTKKVVATFRSHKPIFAIDSFGNSVCFGGRETCFRSGQISI